MMCFFNFLRLQKCFSIAFLLLFLSWKVSGQQFKKTASGLEYLILERTSQLPVKKSYRVDLQYTTRLNSDTALFDSNKPGTPFKFIVGEAEGLKGWDEALLLLNIGDSAVFRIPPALGFGSKRIGKIPGNSTLIFSVRVLSQQQAYFTVGNVKGALLDSGLIKFKVKESNGLPVQPFQMLSMNFTGYIKDEEGNRRIFESSLTNSNKAVFQLGAGRMVSGLEKGLLTMRVGEKASFQIAPNLAFGQQKNGIIPANSTLYFDIEMVDAFDPFFSDAVHDTLFGFGQLKILKRVSKQGSFISPDEIVKFHCLTYKLNAAGHKIVLNNTRESGQPATVRAGAPVKNMGLNQGLPYLRNGEKATIIVPASKETGNIPENHVDFFYHDVEILDVRPYPFFDHHNRDTLLSGNKVKYLVVKSGHGPAVLPKHELTFAYTGYFISYGGRKKIFDASRENGKFLTFELERSQVIPGFEIGIQGMSLGEARTIIIPPQLAYGEKGLTASGIPPNTVLYFDVEFIQMKPLDKSDIKTINE